MRRSALTYELRNSPGEEAFCGFNPHHVLLPRLFFFDLIFFRFGTFTSPLSEEFPEGVCYFKKRVRFNEDDHYVVYIIRRRK